MKLPTYKNKDVHTCDSPLMAMREIGCSDEGDWGLDEGGFYDRPLGRLIK